jgi:hypothetical protein
MTAQSSVPRLSSSRGLCILTLIASLYLGFAPAVQAQVSAGVTEMQNATNTKGLCIPDNKCATDGKVSNPDDIGCFYDKGYCKALYEALTNEKSCVAKKLEEVRKRLLNETSGLSQAQIQAQNKDGMSYGGLSCDSKDQKSITDVAKKKEMFAFLVMQLMSSVAIEESGWTEKKPGGGDKAESAAAKGVFNLTRDQMKDEKYACACKEMVGVGDARSTPEFEDNWPLDAPHSLVCGTYMALHHAAEDGTLFSGSSEKDPNTGKDSLKGASKIFKSLQEPPQTATEPDPENPKQPKNRIAKKIDNYCKKNVTVNAWNPSDPRYGIEDLNPPSSSR